METNHLILISSMIHQRAMPVAQRLGIATFIVSLDLVWKEAGRFKP